MTQRTIILATCCGHTIKRNSVVAMYSQEGRPVYQYPGLDVVTAWLTCIANQSSIPSLCLHVESPDWDASARQANRIVSGTRNTNHMLESPCKTRQTGIRYGCSCRARSVVQAGLLVYTLITQGSVSPGIVEPRDSQCTAALTSLSTIDASSPNVFAFSKVGPNDEPMRSCGRRRKVD